MTQPIGNDLVVTMHYTLKDDDGNVLDSSEGSDPLAYLHGGENIIPGLAKALAGQVAGDSLQVKVEPAEGYGEVEESLIQTIKREAFDGIDSIEAGMEFEAESSDNEVQNFVVTEVQGDDITIDANHPLAGMRLNFDIKVVEVRKATAEETSHGHPH